MISAKEDIVYVSGQELYNRVVDAGKIISRKTLGAQIGRVIYREKVDHKKRIASLLGITPNKMRMEADYTHIDNYLKGTALNIDGIKSIIRDLNRELGTLDSNFTKIAYKKYDGKYNYILNELYAQAKGSDTVTIFNEDYFTASVKKSYGAGLGRLYDLGAIGLSPRLSPHRETYVEKTCYLRKGWKNRKLHI